MDERTPWERPEDDTSPQSTVTSTEQPEHSEHTEHSGQKEGVRIIGADEAAEALERGDAEGRRPEGTPRYGDRPEAPPEDARPPFRFPLGAGSDATEVLRPKVSTGPGTTLPPWTDPPTGEVPRILPAGRADEGGSGDDLEAWSSFATSAPRWRDHPGDWDAPDYDDASLFQPDTRIGALDDSDRPAPDDFFATLPGGNPGEAAGSEPRVVRTGGRGSSRTPDGSEPAAVSGGGTSERDVRTAVGVGVAFAAAAAILFALGPGWAVVLVTAVVVIAAAELFTALRQAGHQPATLLGLVASGSLVLSAYWRGETAIPLVLALTVVGTLLWYLVGVTRYQPTLNIAMSVFAVVYVGLLGSFGALILVFPNGVGVFLGCVLLVVANDTGALAAGRRFGRSRLAPEISPNKTWEGLIGGTLASFVVSVVVLRLIGIHPWDEGLSALALAAVISVAAPLGDLCESMIKRDLNVKDMGTVLPGHGGLLDRCDALLFALPATYYLCRLLEVF